AFFKEEKHNAELATEEVRDEFRKKAEEIYSEGETAATRLAELELRAAELESAVAQANASIEKKTEHSKELIAEQLVELKQEQESVRAMLNGEAFVRLREMEEKISGIENEYHRLNAAVVHAGEVESRLMALEASAGESVSGIHEQIRVLEDKSRAEWDKQRLAAETLLRDETLGRANFELGKLTGELEKRISAYRQEMDQHAEKLFIRVSDLRERAEKQTEALGMREAAFVQRFERQLVAMEEGKNGVVERFVEETKSRGEGIVSDFEEKLAAEEVGARKMIEKLFKEVEEARGTLSEVREEEKAIVADFDKRLKAKEKDIILYFDKCAEEYRQLFQDSAGRTDQKMDRVFH
ncbi:MAG: hypothetical protein JNM63_08890, partial [Spirochaetia bacterium]|nr:hypothetical protein [Spirochaetia bacterium]